MQIERVVLRGPDNVLARFSRYWPDRQHIVCTVHIWPKAGVQQITIERATVFNPSEAEELCVALRMALDWTVVELQEQNAKQST